MKKLLSIVVAAMFAAVNFNAMAQKDVTTKKSDAVKTKDGKEVMTKDVRAAPKGGPGPTIKPAKKKDPIEKTEVKTKSGGDVTTKSGDVKSRK